MTTPPYVRFPDEAHQHLLELTQAADDAIREGQLSTMDAMMLINGLAEVADTLAGAIPAAEATHSAINLRIDATNIGVKTAQDGVDTLQASVKSLRDNLAAEVTRATQAEAARLPVSRGKKTSAAAGSLLGIGVSMTVDVPLTPTPTPGYMPVIGVIGQADVINYVANADSVTVTVRTTAALSLGSTVTVHVIAA